MSETLTPVCYGELPVAHSQEKQHGKDLGLAHLCVLSARSVAASIL